MLFLFIEEPPTSMGCIAAAWPIRPTAILVSVNGVGVDRGKVAARRAYNATTPDLDLRRPSPFGGRGREVVIELFGGEGSRCEDVLA